MIRHSVFWFTKLILYSFYQKEIIKILNSPAFDRIAEFQPRFPFKYLSEYYLVKGMKTSTRASCQIFHYNFLLARLPYILLREILYNGIPVYSVIKNDVFYTIDLKLSSPFINEGEFSLLLKSDHTQIFVLSFTVIQGYVADISSDCAILISRLQGTKGCFTEIRQATKYFAEISPAAILFSALIGVSQALTLHDIGGVSGAIHPSNPNPHCPDYLAAYDAFFESVGAVRSSSGFFCIKLPISEKPLTEIRRDRRRRAQKKRETKAAIAEAVTRQLARLGLVARG